VEDKRRGAPLVRGEATWLAYGMLGFYNFLLSGLGPLMPALSAELGFSYAVASSHFSAFAVGMIVAGLVGARLVARWGRAAVFWTGAVGLAAGAVGLTAFRHPWLTVGSVLVMGAVGSLALVLIPAILADVHGARRALAIVEANTLSAATGALAGLLIGAGERTALGWRGGFLLSLLIPLVLIARFRSTPLPAASRLKGGLPGSGGLPPAYWAFWAAVVLAVCVEFSLIFWGAEFLVAAGLSTSAAATTVSLFLWGMVAGRVAGRVAGQRIAPERLLPLALAVSLAGFLVYWLPPALPARIAGLFVAGFGVANLFPLTSALALGAAPLRSDEAAARLSFASGAAVLTAPLLLGALAGAVGIRLAYGVVPLLLFGALAAGHLGRRWGERLAAGGD
jgi:MFS family permease